MILRIFFFVVILLFKSQPWSLADDIKDFEIEGMSVGESLLNYFNKKDIESKKRTYYPKSDKYYIISFGYEDFYETYEVTQFVLKSNDKKYIIHSVSGKLLFQDNFSGCNKKKDIIGKEISEIFDMEPQIDDGDILKADSSGKSISNSLSYFFENGDVIMIDCSDWSEETNFYDNLKVVILPNYVNQWILNEAY